MFLKPFMDAIGLATYLLIMGGVEVPREPVPARREAN